MEYISILELISSENPCKNILYIKMQIKSRRFFNERN